VVTANEPYTLRENDMRIPNKDEDLTGKVCVCSVGRPFIVTGLGRFQFGVAWVGLGLDGKGTAISKEPAVIAESGEEFHNKLLRRFGGKMGYHG